MLPLSETLLRQMMPNAGARLDAHLPFINPALAWGGIDTPALVAAFMAQLAHESGEYRWMQELADGSAYEFRLDLGNTQPGDGPRYKGHGPIQITGRDAHRRCGMAMGLDLIAEPTLICQPEHGTRAACWFWNDKVGGLSPLAARGWFKTVSRLINGGDNGMEERCRYWAVNRALLGLPPVDLDRETDDIKAFQRAHGLDDDGKVGRNTLRKLRAVAMA